MHHPTYWRSVFSSLVIAPALALALLAGFSAAAGAQEDDRQYGVEDLVPGDAYLGEETATYDVDMVDPGTISEANPYLETEIIDPSAVSIDTDGDGLTDIDEGTYGTDPQFADSDGDGLTDGAEFHQHGTFPWAWDTEGDGLGDGEELFSYGTDPLQSDTDHDRFSDHFEVAEVGSDPTNPETDGDGLLDGEDPRPLR